MFENFLTQRLSHPTDSQQRVRWFRFCFSLFGILLFAVTWKLWSPQTVFPQIPFFAVELPAWIHWLSLAGIFAGLLCSGLFCTNQQIHKIALCLFLGCLLVSILLDQQRLQAWAYEFILITLILVCCPVEKVSVYLRLLLISIYTYSAISKLDYLFLHTLGQQFLEVMFSYTGVQFNNIAEDNRVLLALLFPLGELLIAILLCVRRCWRYAVVLAIVMHLLLLLILGPWGLSHKMGVWMWNLFFIGKITILFYLSKTTQLKNSSPTTTAERSASSILFRGAIAAAIILPLLTGWGLWDHWLGWGLYSPNNSQVHVYIQRNSKQYLPPSMHGYLETNRNENWLRLRIDRWSLDTLQVPIYPEARVQFGVAAAVVRDPRLQQKVRLVVLERSDRFTGQREASEIFGWLEIDRKANYFWVNTRANFRFLGNNPQP